MSEPLTMVLVYDESSDNFFPLEKGKKADPDINTHLIIDEKEKLITLSFPPSASLIEKRTIERRVSSFLKAGYNVPGTQGLRIGAGFPLKKLDPKSDTLPDILLSRGHAYGQSGSTQVKTGSSSSSKPQTMVDALSSIPGPATSPRPVQTSTPMPEPKPEIHTKTEAVAHPPASSGVTIDKSDEHLFILGQFVDMLVQKGNDVMVTKQNGKYHLATVKKDKNYVVEGTQLFEK